MDVNKCIFSGRLCEDPEVKDIGDGKKLARFRLAVECYKKEDKKVNFLKFVTWNCANFAEKNLKRGMKVLVESTCNSGSYLYITVLCPLSLLLPVVLLKYMHFFALYRTCTTDQ